MRIQRGIGNSLRWWLEALGRVDPGDMEFLLYSDGISALRYAPDGQSFKHAVIAPGLPYPLWEQVALPIRAARDGVDVLVSPANTAPLLRSANMAQLVVVNDTMYLMGPERLPPSPSVYQRMGRAYAAAVVPRLLRSVELVCAISECTARDIREADSSSAARIKVIALAPNPMCRPLPVAERDGSGMILLLGAIDPRKNTPRAMRAFDRTARELPDSRLVIVGVDEPLRRVLDVEMEKLRRPDRVELRPFVPDEELLQLYHSAALLFFPSLYEGFGLPILDAMASGTPVVASNAGAVREVSGAAAVLVDAMDELAMAGALVRVCRDRRFASQLSCLGLDRAAEFSWNKTAAALRDGFREAAARRVQRGRAS